MIDILYLFTGFVVINKADHRLYDNRYSNDVSGNVQ